MHLASYRLSSAKRTKGTKFMRGCCEAYLEEVYECMVAILGRQVPALHGLEVGGVLHVGLD